jgi:hypothetical protein
MERAAMGAVLTARDVMRKAGRGGACREMEKAAMGARSPPEEASGGGNVHTKMERALTTRGGRHGRERDRRKRDRERNEGGVRRERVLEFGTNLGCQSVVFSYVSTHRSHSKTYRAALVFCPT